MDKRISFQLKPKGIGYGGLAPVFTTPQLLLDALKALGIEVEDYANTQAQVIADQCFGSDAEVRWAYTYPPGGGHYFYPLCPTCRKTRNFCTCQRSGLRSCSNAEPASDDLLKRIQRYKMTYGPGQLNKSVYLTSVVFGYRGYHYQLFPGFAGGHLSATIWEDGETLPIDTTPEFDSAWNTHKATEIMINDLIREETELDEPT